MYLSKFTRSAKPNIDAQDKQQAQAQTVTEVKYLRLGEENLLTKSWAYLGT